MHTVTRATGHCRHAQPGRTTRRGLFAADKGKTDFVAAMVIEQRALGIVVTIDYRTKQPLHMGLGRGTGCAVLHVRGQDDKAGIGVTRRTRLILSKTGQWLAAVVLHLENLVGRVEGQTWVPAQAS